MFSLLTLNIFRTLFYIHIDDFKQRKIYWKSVLEYSVYTGAERYHGSTVVIVNFEQITPCFNVSNVDFENVFIFWA